MLKIIEKGKTNTEYKKIQTKVYQLIKDINRIIMIINHIIH